MEQDEHAVLDPSEVNAEQGSEAPPVAVLAGEVAGAEERVSEVDSSVRVAEPEGAKNHDLKEPSPGSDEEVAAASGGVQSEDRRAFVNPVANHSAPGATVAIAHATPPDSYRRAPSRSRKQHSPKRSVDAAGAPPPAAAPPAGDPPRSGSAASDGEESSSSSSSSPGGRPPSRGRKQPRPELFIPVKDRATARAKVRRRDISLDSFLTSPLRGSPASRSEWARNVIAGNTASRASGSGKAPVPTSPGPRSASATPVPASSGPRSAATTPVPAGSGPRSAASGPHATARSPVRWQRRRGVLQASPAGDGDSTASSARRLRKVRLLFRP